MNKSEIIKKIKLLNLPKGQYAIFGSGPLAVHGIRDTRDIDLIVLPKLYERLKELGWKEKSWPSGDNYLTKDNFEAAIEWNYNEYKPDIQQLINNADIIEDIPFIQLREVLKWKKAYAREKDTQDIILIENYLKK